MRRTLMFAGLCFLIGCTNPDVAIRALEGAGYTEIRVAGWSPYSCSDSDQYATSFTAKGPTGKSVAGTVCSGVFKGATIRTN